MLRVKKHTLILDSSLEWKGAIGLKLAWAMWLWQASVLLTIPSLSSTRADITNK